MNISVIKCQIVFIYFLEILQLLTSGPVTNPLLKLLIFKPLEMMCKQTCSSLDRKTWNKIGASEKQLGSQSSSHLRCCCRRPTHWQCGLIRARQLQDTNPQVRPWRAADRCRDPAERNSREEKKIISGLVASARLLFICVDRQQGAAMRRTKVFGHFWARGGVYLAGEVQDVPSLIDRTLRVQAAFRHPDDGGGTNDPISRIHD